MVRVLRTLTLGRSSDCDVTLGDATVSRRHASLEINPDGTLTINDLGSANGTSVQAGDEWERIDRATIRRDQPIRFGTLEVIPRDLLDALDPVILLDAGDAGGQGLADGESARALPEGVVEIRSASERELLNRPRRNPDTGDIEEQN